jgi:sec-independent protein translocase protein TatA
MSQIGVPGIILIVLIALLLFGPNKLPQLGRAFGRTLREFKEGTRELMKDDDKDDSEKGPRANVVEAPVVEAPVVEAKKEDKRLPD